MRRIKTVIKVIKYYLKSLDKFLLTAVVGCSALSIVLIYSIYANKASRFVYPSTYKTQIIAVVLGLCGALVLAAIDYERLAKLWYIYVPPAVGLVLLTFTSFGKMREGTAADDKAWLRIAGVSIQPSEFLKIAFILSFAYHIYKMKDKINQPLVLLTLCAHGGIAIGLIALQGDGGTAIVFGFIFVTMLFVAGISWKYIVSVLLASPLLAVFVWFVIMSENQRDRFMIVFNPERDPLGLGNQQIEGKIALGSGMLHGKGLFGGQYKYVAEMHNDFIFSYMGQVFGFIGCIALCVVIVYIAFKILYNGMKSKDKLGLCICAGVFAMYFSQAVMNIGMVLAVLPVIGVPLPLISAGGSSVLSTYLAIGLVLSVYAHGERSNSLFY